MMGLLAGLDLETRRKTEREKIRQLAFDFAEILPTHMTVDALAYSEQACLVSGP